MDQKEFLQQELKTLQERFAKIREAKEQLTQQLGQIQASVYAHEGALVEKANDIAALEKRLAAFETEASTDNVIPMTPKAKK